jgi:hypothetical protein
MLPLRQTTAARPTVCLEGAQHKNLSAASGVAYGGSASFISLLNWTDVGLKYCISVAACGNPGIDHLFGLRLLEEYRMIVGTAVTGITAAGRSYDALARITPA